MAHPVPRQQNWTC